MLDSSYRYQEDYEPNLAKVTLRRVGYYTIPPIDQLDNYEHAGTCVVPNFTVGRKGYGNVYFPDSFDVYGLNLDEIGKTFTKIFLKNSEKEKIYNKKNFLIIS